MGHSAADIYELLHRRGVELEAKAFAMGVRIEHPQHLIDSIQYHNPEEGDVFPQRATRWSRSSVDVVCTPFVCVPEVLLFLQ